MARLVRIPYDQARRLTALATSDDLTAFVVGQTYIELVLRGMLAGQLYNKRRFESMRVSYGWHS